MFVDPRIDHHIQKDIMFRLIKAEVVTFSQLKPDGIESNLFMYHLRQLMRQGIVAKAEGGYCLTEIGKSFVDRASLTSMKLRLQPKMVTILAVRDDQQRWLLLERLHQPFLHHVGFPSGKLHYGEDVTHAAQRELKEKTGITGANLQFRGTIFLRFFARDDHERTVNHLCGFVFSGQLPAGAQDGFRTENFRTFWGMTERLMADDAFRGNQEVLAMLDSPTISMCSYQFESDF